VQTATTIDRMLTRAVFRIPTRGGARFALCAAAVLLAFVPGGVSAGLPLIQQGPKLTASDEVGAVGYGGGKFGSSAALSADGRTALIGGYYDNDATGAAWVFTRSGSTWKQQGPKLTAGKHAEFGYSVALSGDGNTALIGSSNNNSQARGAAWVFRRSGSTWTKQAELHGTKSGPTVQDGFGMSVALSADGDTALIGAGTYTLFGSVYKNVGSAFVFKRFGSTWKRQGKVLTGKAGAGAAGFGTVVALSRDGDTAVIGGAARNQASGAAWVFTRSGSTWTQQGSKLTAAGARGSAGFGCSVALSADGAAALIGACADSANAGAAWMFTRSGTIWKQGPKLTATGGSPGGLFGFSAGLSADAKTAVIGGPGGKGGVGAAWVFTRSGSIWTQRGSELTASGKSGPASFGYSVALSSDGKVAVIGGPNDSGGVGAAWVKVERL
jgi:hypothetical protein